VYQKVVNIFMITLVNTKTIQTTDMCNMCTVQSLQDGTDTCYIFLLHTQNWSALGRHLTVSSCTFLVF